MKIYRYIDTYISLPVSLSPQRADGPEADVDGAAHAGPLEAQHHLRATRSNFKMGMLPRVG